MVARTLQLYWPLKGLARVLKKRNFVLQFSPVKAFLNIFFLTLSVCLSAQARGDFKNFCLHAVHRIFRAPLHWQDLRIESQRFAPKLKRIKVCAFDVDGTLTDGCVFYAWDGEGLGLNQATSAVDYDGMKMLMENGILTGVITAREGLFITNNFDYLDFVYQGKRDKREAFLSLLERGHRPSEVLYMGDGLFDIPLLKKAGFSATCSDAPREVQEAVDYVASRPGGRGCVREVIDMLRYAQNLKVDTPDFGE